MTAISRERELAGYVAPIVRGASERVLQRRVRTYDRATGETTGETTMREALGGLVKATALGLEVIEGVRPKAVPCQQCQLPVKVGGARGGLPTVCRFGTGCRKRQRAPREARPEWVASVVCAGACGATPSEFLRKKIQARTRKNPAYAWRCRECYQGPPPDQVTCDGGCGREVPSHQNQKGARAKRGGRPWVCAECAPPQRTPRPRPMCPCGKAPAGPKCGMCGPCWTATITKPPGKCITCDAAPKQRQSLAKARAKGREWQCWECAHGQPRPSEPGRPRGRRPPKETGRSQSIAAAQERVAARGAKKKADPGNP